MTTCAISLLQELGRALGRARPVGVWRRVGASVGWALAAYLLFLHGCHADEDLEALSRFRVGEPPSATAAATATVSPVHLADWSGQAAP